MIKRYLFRDSMMVQDCTVSDRTAADKSSIGFDYQYYFFLWKVLCLQPNQSVGLEYKDDVHTDLDNDIQILYQLKHTVQKSKSTDKPVNLTSLDSDLWKTLSNWARLIQDSNAGRSQPHEQLKFVQKTIFVLASNKSISKYNSVSSLIDKIIDGEILSSNLKDEIRKISEKSNSENIKNYSESITKLSDDVLFNYFKNVHFELEQEYIIDKCRDATKAKMIEDKDVEIAFKLIDSTIKEDNFINIKANEKIIISFENFHMKYRKYFQRFQNSNLKFYEFNESLPSNLENLTFIKQLIEIEDFDKDDMDSMIEYVLLMLKTKKNINNWSCSGEITHLDLLDLENNTILEWKNKWRAKYRKFDESSHNDLALELVDDMRSKTITHNVLPNDLAISNGYLYHLSETPEIGWRKD